MKVFLLTEYYPQYLDSFYRRNDLSHLGYQEHLEALLQDRFGDFVSYRNHLRKLGHEAVMVIGNDSALQRKWLKERGVRRPAWGMNKKDIVLLQIQEFSPDFFFMDSIFDYYGDFLKRVSGITKNIFTWVSCPYSDGLDFSNIACIISSAVPFVKRFRERSLNSEILKAAFDGDIIPALDNEKTMDVSFIGGLSRSTHTRRVKGLEHLVAKGIDLKVFGYGLKKSFLPFFTSPLWLSYGGERWGMDMLKTLNNSKISLNFHIDVAQGFGGNMRLYEATGCGSLVMTENTPDMKELFEPGKEIVVYDSFDDLADKIRYFLSHGQELEDISKRGHKACLEKHGYDNRIKEFESILLKYS
jgi:glycosyltransferase involved in cell wall biosynthesis